MSPTPFPCSEGSQQVKIRYATQIRRTLIENKRKRGQSDDDDQAAETEKILNGPFETENFL